MRKYITELVAVPAALIISAAEPAVAVDGVLEINQACAVIDTAEGCFSGDTPGWPVTITTAGSYRLTGNLSVSDENTNGIEISANGVTLDLNGFTISGPSVCSGEPVTGCAPTGTGVGVKALSATVSDIVVRNGMLRGHGLHGAELGVARIQDIVATNNGGRGVVAGDFSTVSRSTFSRNGSSGLTVGRGSVVTQNTSTFNGSSGISTSFGCTTVNNALFENGGDGIQSGAQSTVSGNTSYGNSEHGFEVGNGSVVAGNATGSNMLNGLQGPGSGPVQGVGYVGNVMHLNGGTTAGTMTAIGANLCDGVVCP